MDKIIVHERQKVGKNVIQKIEIYYNVIGKFELPEHYKLESITKAEFEKLSLTTA